MDVTTFEKSIEDTLKEIKNNMKHLRETRHYAILYSKDEKIDPKKREALVKAVKAIDSLLAFFSFSSKGLELKDRENKLQFIRLIEPKKRESIDRIDELIEFIKKNNIRDVNLEFLESLKKDLEKI